MILCKKCKNVERIDKNKKFNVECKCQIYGYIGKGALHCVDYEPGKPRKLEDEE